MSEIKSDKIEIIPIDTLIPHPKNMNVHTEEQIEALARLIEYQGMRTPIIAQKGTNLVVAGNGRLLALKKLGKKEAPVSFQEFDSEAQLYAFMVSDNAINAKDWGGGLDFSQINLDIQDLGPELDIEMLAIKDFTIEPFENLEKNLKEKNINKFILQVELLNGMELDDLFDDLSSKGYKVKKLT